MQHSIANEASGKEKKILLGCRCHCLLPLSSRSTNEAISFKAVTAADSGPPCQPSTSSLAAAGADFAAIVARVCFKAQIASARQKYGQGKGNVVRMEQRGSRKTAAQHWLLAIIHENIHTKQKATGFPSHSFLFHTLSSLSLSNSSWKAFSSCWQLRANLLIAIFLH